MFASQPDPTPRLSFGTVLVSVIGLWTAYLVLMTLRAYLLQMDLVWQLFERRLVTCLLGVLITLGLWMVLRAFDARPLWVKITAALIFALPAALLSMQANRLVFSDMQQAYDEQMLEELAGRQGIAPEEVDSGVLEELNQLVALGSREAVIEITFSRYFMMLAWCALYLALLTGERARVAERREQEFRSAARAAELRSLRYQVNPHFLFNTLNSLSALVLTRKPEEAERMIHMLSTFYRRSLADDPTQDVTLGAETRLQTLYLDIEAVRFPRRLRVQCDVPATLHDALVPGMILQPLVENSVKHAVAPSNRPVTIRIAAQEEYGRLVITVADDGDAAGAQPRSDRADGMGIGLANVRERLEARFGDAASIVSGPRDGGYATILRLPMRRDRDGTRKEGEE